VHSKKSSVANRRHRDEARTRLKTFGCWDRVARSGRDTVGYGYDPHGGSRAVELDIPVDFENRGAEAGARLGRGTLSGARAPSLVRANLLKRAFRRRRREC
jgi:hypothetical protein